MLKTIKQTRPATWLAGGAIALSANAADAALVQVAISDGVRDLATNSSFSFGSSVGLSATLTVAFRRRTGISAGYLYKIGTGFLAYDLSNRTFVPRSYGYAGSFSGGGREDLLGIRPISLVLTAGGFVEGWVVVINDFALFGAAGVTHFIYNDADLGNRDGAGSATRSGFLNGDYATVATVAAVPEPSSIALLALGAAGVMLRRNRKLTAA